MARRCAIPLRAKVSRSSGSRPSLRASVSAATSGARGPYIASRRRTRWPRQRARNRDGDYAGTRQWGHGVRHQHPPGRTLPPPARHADVDARLHLHARRHVGGGAASARSLCEGRGSSGGARDEVTGKDRAPARRARGHAAAGANGRTVGEGAGGEGGEECDPGCGVGAQPCPDGRDREEEEEERGGEAPEVGGEGGAGGEGQGQARHRGEATDQGGGASRRRSMGVTPCFVLP